MQRMSINNPNSFHPFHKAWIYSLTMLSVAYSNIKQNQCAPNFLSRSYNILPTLRYDYSHLRITSSRDNIFPIRPIHIFSATSFQPSSGTSLNAPISLKMNNSSSLTLPHTSSLFSLRSFRKSFMRGPCSKTKRMTGLASMSFFCWQTTAGLGLIFLVESAARMAEVGLLRRMLELGLGRSSGSSSAVSLSPRLDLRRLVRSPDSRLVFFLFSSIFFIRCCTSALRSLSSIILLQTPPPTKLITHSSTCILLRNLSYSTAVLFIIQQTPSP